MEDKMQEKKRGFWSAGRLVIGILLIVFSLVVLFQSCAAGVVNTLESSSDAGGSAGFLLAIFMIASGVTAICTRNSRKKAGPIIAAVLLAVGALTGFFNAAVYQDLIIWGIVSLASAVVFIICAIKTKKA
ncbi:MAG: hypothetical protein Q4A40_01165 [Bacillota bacterium]|nr:hypothetical protein [Bacillota bacterium]